MPDFLSRLTASDRFADVARVSLSLIGVAAFCFLDGRMNAIVPLMLGVIACALSEPDDSGWRRLGSLIVTLICFSGTAIIVELLDPFPPLFALGLIASTFSLSMLVAVSNRWGQIATGTLILAVYTMIGMELHPDPATPDFISGPLYLTLGAAWYGLFSLVWTLAAPLNAVRHALANLFDALAAQVDGAAAMFAPYRETDREAIRLGIAATNSATVAALNACRAALLDRMGRKRRGGDTEEKLRLYFVAQDIHERISSAHYPHDELVAAFFHSDLLFRCRHLLQMQAKTLRDIAGALRHRAALPACAASRAALRDLREALDFADKTGAPSHLIAAVNALVRNIEGLQGAIERPQAAEIEGQILQNPEPSSLREAGLRLWSQMTPRSGLFRHAVRLSVGMLAGYLFIRGAHLQQGHWIMLTTLLVGQQSYGATKRRLVERVVGTAVGVVIGWASLQLMPQQPLQLILIVAAGVAFFAWRRRRYPAATAMITLFVVLSFEQILSGYAVIGPRLFDTLVGVAISLATFYLVLPDWKVRRIKDRLAEALGADARYLRAVGGQYEAGRADDLAYRIVRRDAHNAHAAFDRVIRDILSEPRHTATKLDASLQALRLAHTLLSYLSALGAHRKGGTFAADDPLRGALEAAADDLDALAAAYRVGVFVAVAEPAGAPVPEVDDVRRLIAQHGARIERIACDLRTLGPTLCAE